MRKYVDLFQRGRHLVRKQLNYFQTVKKLCCSMVGSVFECNAVTRGGLSNLLVQN